MKNRANHRVGRMIGMAAGVAGLLAAAAPAANFIWYANGPNANWNAQSHSIQGYSTNWTSFYTPIPNYFPPSDFSTTLEFTNHGSGASNNNLADPFKLNSLTFDPGAASFTITGNGLEFMANGATGPSINSSATDEEVDVPLTLDANLNLAVNGLGNLLLGGQVTGSSGGIYKNGAGSLILTGGTAAAPSAFSFLHVGGGGAAIHGGAINLSATGSTGFGGESSLFVDAGAGLRIDNGAQLTTYGTPQVHNDGEILVTGVGTLWTNDDAPGGPAADIRIGYAGGASTLEVSVGAQVISQGNLTIGNSAYTASPGIGAVTVEANSSISVGRSLVMDSTSTLEVHAGSTLTAGALSSVTGSSPTIHIADPTTGGVALTVGSDNANTTFGGIIADDTDGAGSLEKVGTGTLTLTGNNTYTGHTIVTGGTLAITAGTIGDANTLLFTVDGATSAKVSLSGGSIQSNYEYIGKDGTGFFQQSGNSNNNSGGVLYLGYDAGSTGTYNLLDTSTLSTSETVVGANGNGTFTQSGGTHTTQELEIAEGSGSTGIYHLDGGSLSASSSESVGGQGAGTFIQTAGSNTTGLLVLAAFPGITGTYTLSGSTSNLSTAVTYVGYEGNATFNQSGGTHTITADSSIGVPTGVLDLGEISNSTGTYNLSGGSLSATNDESVGFAGTGHFNQTGGTNTTTHLYVGAGATGTYSLSGDDTSAVSTADTYVGYDGDGTFTQSGGKHKITDNLDIGTDSTAIGTYNLSGGSVSTASEFVGDSGTGTLDQTGGSNSALDLYVGKNSGSIGTYTLSGNASALTTSNTLVGFNSQGTFTQSGGTHTTTGMVLGQNPGSAGTYNLSGGSLITTGEYVGAFGAGTFNQTGGSNNADNFYVGANSGSIATYTLSGDSSTLSTTDTRIGSSGDGTFTQSGGTNTISDNLTIGEFSGGAGTYNLGGGSLSVTFIEYVGNSGTGTFNQTGGSNSVIDVLIGENAGAAGTYNLSGDTSTISASGMVVGDAGNGIFNQSGGTETDTFHLILGFFASASGTYNLSGGSLETPTEYIGDTGAGMFNQTGGSNTTNVLNVGSNAGAIGAYNLNGGSLTAGSVSGGSGTSSFNFDGGTLYAAGDNSDFITTVTTLNVQVGGAKINTNGHNITINQLLQHDTTTGADAIDGGLTKSGVGTLTLTAANTYTGGTLVTGGNLSIDNDNELGDAAGALTVLGTGKVVLTDSINTSRIWNLGLSAITPASGGSITYNAATINNGSLGAGNHFLNDGTSLNQTFAANQSVLTQNGTVSFTNVLLNTGSTLTQNTGATLNTAGYFVALPGSTLTINGTVNTQGASIGGALTINNNGTFATGNDTSVEIGALVTYPATNDIERNDEAFRSATEKSNEDTPAVFNNAGTLQADAGSNINVKIPMTMTGGSFAGAGLVTTSDITFSNTSAKTGAGPLVIVGTPTFTAGAKFDIGQGPVLIEGAGYDPAAITTLIASAYDHGKWDGAGITSSEIASHPATAVGVGDNAILGLSTFDGQPVNDSLILTYTWLGDANLDGIVNAADFSMVKPTGTADATWSTGDFNYDGVVNGDDYALFMLGAAESGGANISTTVPEPSVMLSGVLLILSESFFCRDAKSKAIARRRRVRAIYTPGADG